MPDPTDIASARCMVHPAQCPVCLVWYDLIDGHACLRLEDRVEWMRASECEPEPPSVEAIDLARAREHLQLAQDYLSRVIGTPAPLARKNRLLTRRHLQRAIDLIDTDGGAG